MTSTASSTRKRPRTTQDPSYSIAFEETGRVPPRVNVFEHSDSMVTTTFELPGLKREDVTVDLLHNKLTVWGKFNDVKEEGTYAVHELPSGKFSRTLTLPLGMRPQDFKARMENGLLTLKYPKHPPEQVPHRIPIE